METFSHSNLNTIAINAINQKGYGDDIDRYIYSQTGEGLGSFFGNMFKKAIPFIAKSIKGAAKVASPHIKAGLKAGGESALKRGIEEVTKIGGDKLLDQLIHKPHKRTKQGL